MKCPSCGSDDIKVVDSRPVDDNNSIRRRRICDDCNKCMQACPVNALEKEELNQQACWDHAFGEDEKLQTWVISCHKCRDACPYNLGVSNGAFLSI